MSQLFRHDDECSPATELTWWSPPSKNGDQVRERGTRGPTEVWCKSCSGASPSHKPQQLSSTAPGMCRKGCSLTARRGERHSRGPGGSAASAGQLTHASLRNIPPYLLRRGAIDSAALPPQTRPPSLSPLCPFGFIYIFGIYQNWVSQTVCQQAAFDLTRALGRGQISVPHSATTCCILSRRVESEPHSPF